MALYPYRKLANLNKVTGLRGNGEGTSLWHIQLINLDNCLMLANECVRYITGLHYELLKDETLLSPEQMVIRRFDPLAINVIETNIEEY